MFWVCPLGLLPVSWKAGTSHPTKEAYFRSLYRWITYLANTQSTNRTVGKGWKIDWIKNFASSLQCLHYCGHSTNPPVCLMLHFNLEQDPELLKFVHLVQRFTSNLKRAIHAKSGREPWLQSWSWWLSSELLNTRLQTTPVPGMMKQRELCNLQEAKNLTAFDKTSGFPQEKENFFFCLFLMN